MNEKLTKSGMIALVGRPNVGKSTLLNALVGEKVSIVTPKPQTTRRRLCAVAARDDTQYVFVDTPGFHKPKTGLGEYMVGIARRSIEGVDAAVLLVEPVPSVGPPEEILLERIQKLKVPVILAINKTDTVPREKLLAVIAAYAGRFAFHAVVPLSALRKEGLDTLFEELHPLMPAGPLLFPKGEVTDQTDRDMIAELFREQILMHLDREVPHGVAVVVETFTETPKPLLEVGVVIVCEKQSHKGIVIGKQGRMLKTIGEKVRKELEEMYEIPVMLSSWVRVKEDWRNKQSQLLDLGFDGK